MSGLRAVLALVAATALAAPAAAGKAPAAPSWPQIVRPGEMFVLRLPPGGPAPESAAFLGTNYPPLDVPGEAGPVFLLGVDLDVEPGAHEIVLLRANGGREHMALRIAKRDFAQERLQLPTAMVTPPKELEERIVREQELAARIYRTSDPEKLWDRGFTRALGHKPADNFGRRRVLNGIMKSPHSGQDYSAPAGTPVKAIAAGRVRLARDLYYSGLTVLLDHGAGMVSQYMHLEKLLVAETDLVAAGQRIGLVGSTGRVTGPHLHLGVRLFEQRVDPESLWRLFPQTPPEDSP